MTRTQKEQNKLGKVNRIFTIKKVNDRRVKMRVKELRRGAKGLEVNRITGSSVVDSLIEKSLD